MARTIYFAENQAAGGTVTGAPVAKRAQFFTDIAAGGALNFDFEDYYGTSSPTAPVDLYWSGASTTINGVITGAGLIFQAPDTGLINTSPAGTVYWASNGTWQIDFDAPIAAFGLYISDVGDNANMRLTARLMGTDAVEDVVLIATTQPGTSGNLAFWGFIDTTKQYTRVKFTPSASDYAGFDDFVIADQAAVAPPATEFWPASCRAYPGGVV